MTMATEMEGSIFSNFDAFNLRLFARVCEHDAFRDWVMISSMRSLLFRLIDSCFARSVAASQVSYSNGVFSQITEECLVGAFAH